MVDGHALATPFSHLAMFFLRAARFRLRRPIQQHFRFANLILGAPAAQTSPLPPILTVSCVYVAATALRRRVKLFGHLVHLNSI
jgi:hypothetical protein